MNIETKTCSKCSETKTVDLFYKSENRCKSCKSAYGKKRYADPVVKAKKNARQREHYANPEVKARKAAKQKERNSTPEAKARISAYQKEYYADPEVKTRKAAREKERMADPEVKAKKAAYNKKRNADPEVKAKMAETAKIWAQDHPEKVNATAAKYRASKLERTPVWSETKEIEAIYAEAQRMTKETGVKHEVDHTYPLQGEFVSGLHVYDNLQILTESENRSKSNKFAVD